MYHFLILQVFPVITHSIPFTQPGLHRINFLLLSNDDVLTHAEQLRVISLFQTILRLLNRGGMMAALSYISMYVLMYAMVNTIGNVFNNFNQFYMAGLMTAPMVLIELFVMRSMFPNKQRNALIIVISIIAALVFFLLIRQQVAISDKQFLRSMIPHPAGAILMCEHASIDDPEVKELCGSILSSQQEQIDQMKAKLLDLEK